MDREHFLQHVEHLREQGQSIRTIAAALGVNRGRVERAIKISALRRSYRPGQLGGIRSASENKHHAAACDAISRAGMRGGTPTASPSATGTRGRGWPGGAGAVEAGTERATVGVTSAGRLGGAAPRACAPALGRWGPWTSPSAPVLRASPGRLGWQGESVPSGLRGRRGA